MAGADLRPDFTVFQAAFGVPVVVTRPAPDDDEIETEGIWLPDVAAEYPGAFDIQRQESRKVLALPIADVPTVPVTPSPTRFLAPEVRGGATKRWRAVAVLNDDVDHKRVLVIPDPES